MDNIAYMIFLFVMGFYAASRAFHYLFTPTDELYSYYRNTIDVSPTHFKKRLVWKRIIWAVVTIALLVPAFYMFFN